MSKTTDWPLKVDEQIVKAILDGKIEGKLAGLKPDKHIETGLAHVFFFGDTVFKFYKSHDDHTHFIKGVLAPTKRRHQYIIHDFETNRHFSQGTYRALHKIGLSEDGVVFNPDGHNEIHFLHEMDKLDFSKNLHERLITGDVSDTDLYLLGREVARLMHTAKTEVPEDISWHSQAKKRMVFLRQFIDWLPERYKNDETIKTCLDSLDSHLEEHKEEYEALVGDALCADLDNHDENVFIEEDNVRIIDTIPPMDCWWYGVPESNLSALMVNVEAMLSAEMAHHIKRGFDDFYGKETIRDNIYEFTRAFNYLISIAHYASLDDKREIAEKYVKVCTDIPNRL